MSGTWIVVLSSMARPTTSWRVKGNGPFISLGSSCPGLTSCVEWTATGLTSLSSISTTYANGASHRCAARSATAWSTGRTSVGDAEVTRRISLIAVCCSSAFVSSRVRSSTLRSRPAYDSRNWLVIRLN